MRIAATILAGGDRESVIVEAIESAATLVDHYVLINTGESARKALLLAHDLLGEKLTVCRYTGEFDCASARNYALDCAAELGFDWALILDTDERIHGKAGVIRRMLSEVATNTVIVANAENDCYRKPKFIRLPCDGYWDGRIHEGYVSGPTTLARGVSFSELPKSEEELRRLNERVARVTSEELERHPTDARMLYYHADALMALGQVDEAIRDFLACAQHSTWDEEQDWATYRAALAFGQKLYLRDAFLTAAKSSLRIPELAWYAANCLCVAGVHDEAIRYAHLAGKLGREQRKTDRSGFCDKRTWFELPHDVIRRSARALGRDELAEKADAEFERLQSERLDNLAKLAA